MIACPQHGNRVDDAISALFQSGGLKRFGSHGMGMRGLILSVVLVDDRRIVAMAAISAWRKSRNLK